MSKKYTIKSFTVREISKLQTDWNRLAVGSEMTIFQQYDWYRLLSSNNFDNFDKNYEIRYFSIYKDGSVVCIAPLFCVRKDIIVSGKKTKRGVYFFGRLQLSDFLNFIYNSFDPFAIEYLFNYIGVHYNISNFIFEEMPETSSSYKYFAQNYLLGVDRISECVEIALPKTPEQYLQSLSKNTRQNIRTAQNRAKKDGIELSFNFYDTNVDSNKFLQYREFGVKTRHSTKDQTSWLNQIEKNIKYCFKKDYKRLFPEFKPYMINDEKNVFLTAKDNNGELCSAFYYIKDGRNKRFVIMVTATNPDFYKYSPGILTLFNFVQHLYQNMKQDWTIDLTRGTEKYKFSLGGSVYNNRIIEFDLQSKKR